MKIAVVVSELNIRGGTHKQVLRLCEYLRENKYDFILCTKYLNLEHTYKEFENFNIIYLENKDWQNNVNVNIVRKIINKIKYYRDQVALYKRIPGDVDIINVHDNGLTSFICIAKKHKQKIVWQINDLPAEFFVGAFQNIKKTLRLRLKQLYTKSVARKVDVITVNVTKNKNLVKQCVDRNAEVLYCGIDVNKKLIKHKYINKNQIRLLSTGVFFPHRNYETLVKVIDELRNRKIDVHLDIIGDTKADKTYSNMILDLIRSLHLDSHITVHGQVDDGTYNDLYNKADVFLFINVNQSWGLAVFEAMSCGLPTIVSNSVGAIELLHNGQDAIIVDPFNINEICNQVQRLMIDEQYYNMLSKNASNNTRDYTWDNLYSSKMVEIFKKMGV